MVRALPFSFSGFVEDAAFGLADVVGDDGDDFFDDDLLAISVQYKMWRPGSSTSRPVGAGAIGQKQVRVSNSHRRGEPEHPTCRTR
jgi:hypothetical protein